MFDASAAAPHGERAEATVMNEASLLELGSRLEFGLLCLLM
ncbi:hypothetical protein [Paraburkholderia lacunae]|nr:hypothetical protein [Paraburkholderia lacunae]